MAVQPAAQAGTGLADTGPGWVAGQDNRCEKDGGVDPAAFAAGKDCKAFHHVSRPRAEK